MATCKYHTGGPERKQLIRTNLAQESGAILFICFRPEQRLSDRKWIAYLVTGRNILSSHVKQLAPCRHRIGIYY